MKKLLLIPAIWLGLAPAFAQNQWCITDEYNEEIKASMSSEELLKAMKAMDKQFAAPYTTNGSEKSGTVHTIPTVVHVIHYNCEGNISKEQIEDGIRVLNEDLRRINSDTGNTRSIFKPHAGDTEIEFKLAQIDPNGNCTEGIVRVDHPYSLGNLDERDLVKGLSQWDESKYFNVWLVNNIESGGGSVVLGYARFPWWGVNDQYGIVVRHDQWGSIGTSNADGRTVTHEVGHCLGLLHTFQSGCVSNRSCSNGGDRICDTPPSAQATYNCSKTQNSCSNDAGTGSPYTGDVVDQIENYMSYDNCQNMFSNMQIDVMRSAVENDYNKLINLVSSSNLVATGTNPGYNGPECEPIADFCQETISICEGATVDFEDRSYNGPVNSRNWSFPGGSPATSSDSMPTVTYSTAGTYNVTLTTGNSQGNDSKTMNAIINVLPAAADNINWRYDEDFEDGQDFDDNWTVINPDGGLKWTHTNQASATGTQSVYVRNYVNLPDYRSELYSPSYDLTAVLLPKMTFKVAYARTEQTDNDQLIVEYSDDCGETWKLMRILLSLQMESVDGLITDEFFPDETEWREIDLFLSSNILQQKNVRFKFEHVSGGGNNIYIDDINIESTTGIDSYSAQGQTIIYPNPATSELFIETSKEGLSDVRMIDMQGRTVQSQLIQNTSSNSTNLDVTDLESGIYLVELNFKNGEREVKRVSVR